MCVGGGGGERKREIERKREAERKRDTQRLRKREKVSDSKRKGERMTD